jgi:DNA mismatch repair protein MutH
MLTFPVGRERWLKPGMSGIAVDPKKRDDLVARFRVVRIDASTGVTAVVTGQTTKLTTEHVAVLEEPVPRWYRRKAFWGGLLLGAALGATAGTQF